MENLVKRQIVVLLDIEHLKNSPVLGEIKDEFLAQVLEDYVRGWLILADDSIIPEQGDFYKFSNLSVIMNQSQLDTVRLIHPDDMLPTDEKSILEDFGRLGVDHTELKYEQRCRELENEGMTRSDAQGVADVEGLH